MKINLDSLRNAVRSARQHAPDAAALLQRIGQHALSASSVVSKVPGAVGAAEALADAIKNGRIRVDFGVDGVRIHTGAHERAGGTGNRVVF